MNRISEHISYREATKSLTAIRHNIDNTPSSDVQARMVIWAQFIFEPLRNHFGVPIGISSFFRCTELNKKIKGSKTSQHVKGEAGDIDADIYGGITNADIFNFLKDNADFDQLIWEFGDSDNPAWVHVSTNTSSTNRKEVLIAYKNWRGKTLYKHWSNHR
jgi:zinc D-Ala-D-Ala carboxypeptidase